MNDSPVKLPSPTIPAEVQAFAAQKRLNRYLNAMVELARQAFPASRVSVSLGQDAEDETHRYIALDVDASGHAVEELIVGQRSWTAGVHRVCPSQEAVYFVLGWR